MINGNYTLKDGVVVISFGVAFIIAAGLTLTESLTETPSILIATIAFTLAGIFFISIGVKILIIKKSIKKQIVEQDNGLSIIVELPDSSKKNSDN